MFLSTAYRLKVFSLPHFLRLMAVRLNVEAVACDARRGHLAWSGRGTSVALRADLNARQNDLAVVCRLFRMASSAIAAAVSSMVEFRVLEIGAVIGSCAKSVLAIDECRGMTLAAAARSPHCSDRF